MKLVLALGCLTLPIPLRAQTVEPSDAFRAELAALPEIAVVHDTLAVADIRLGFISAVSADRNGNLYVLHRPTSGDPVVVLDSAGRLVRSWGEGRFGTPHGIRVDPQGNSRIQVFDQTGRWLDTWQYAGMVPSVAVGPTGTIYASLVLDSNWTEGYVVQINPNDGRMLARVAVVAHELAIGPDGTILPAVENAVVRLRPKSSPASPNRK